MSTPFGYATVSSTDQDLSQLAALKAAGCTTIRKEKRPTTSMQGRQELKTLLEFLRKGDSPWGSTLPPKRRGGKQPTAQRNFGSLDRPV